VSVIRNLWVVLNRRFHFMCWTLYFNVGVAAAVFFMPVHLGRLEPEYCLGNSSFSLVLILSSVLFSSVRNQWHGKQTRISTTILPCPHPFFLSPPLPSPCLPFPSLTSLPLCPAPPFSFLPFPPSPLHSSPSLRNRSPLF